LRGLYAHSYDTSHRTRIRRDNVAIASYENV
jgi:hypothetical protein